MALVLPKKILRDFGWNAADTIRVTSDPKKKRLIITKFNSTNQLPKKSEASPTRRSLDAPHSDNVQPIPEL